MTLAQYGGTQINAGNSRAENKDFHCVEAQH